MESAKIEISVPKEMIIYVNSKDKKEELKRNALILYPYIKDLTISHGRAAEILGIRKLDLITLYNEIGLPYLNMDISEVEEDVKTYQAIQRRIR
ncbi:hypothetical protein C804_00693 [Lachnospiraceae bacterium A4]|jgi:hypothetical protein|nr:hypothetical protein C804_00693 [Lachnospiraceae bacterium A4]